MPIGQILLFLLAIVSAIFMDGIAAKAAFSLLFLGFCLILLSHDGIKSGLGYVGAILIIISLGIVTTYSHLPQHLK